MPRFASARSARTGSSAVLISALSVRLAEPAGAGAS
jgi:hypothetical protein